MTLCFSEIITHRKVPNNLTLRVTVKGCGLTWLWICFWSTIIYLMFCVGVETMGALFFVTHIKIFSVSAPTHASPQSFHFQSKNVKVIHLRLKPAHTHTLHTERIRMNDTWMTNLRADTSKACDSSDAEIVSFKAWWREGDVCMCVCWLCGLLGTASPFSFPFRSFDHLKTLVFFLFTNAVRSWNKKQISYCASSLTPVWTEFSWLTDL